MHGTYQTVDQRPALGFERRIAHRCRPCGRRSPRRPSSSTGFPCSVELDLEVGGEMAFTFREQRDGVPTTMSGRVTDLDPPRLFAFYWGDDHLRFELEPVEGGAACVFRMTVILDARDKAARDAAGWHVCLDRLEQHLTGTSVSAPGSEPTTEWRGLYEEYQRRGVPSGAWLPDGV